MTTTHQDLAAQALEALRENHRWHQDYDDHGGYPGSELCTTNEQAIAALEAASQPPGAVEREAFEEFANRRYAPKGYQPERSGDGYQEDAWQLAWEAWSDAGREMADMRRAYELLFKEHGRLRGAFENIESALAAEIECEVFEKQVQPVIARLLALSTPSPAQAPVVQGEAALQRTSDFGQLQEALEQIDALRAELDECRAHSKYVVRALHAQELKALEQREPQCEWDEEDPFEMPGTYRTSCGHLFAFTDGGVAENEAKFCQYCGAGIGVKGAAHG